MLHGKRGMVLALTLAVVGLAAGCGDGKVPVRGKVLFDGQPVEEGTIFLEHVGGAAPSNEGKITGGEYFLPAVVPGKKTAILLAYRGSSRKEESNQPGQPGARGARKEQYLPKKYNEGSQLTREVVPGRENRLDFDLTSSP